METLAATSRSFAEANQNELLLLAQLAEQWHCRPSEMLKSQISDFQIDLACALMLWEQRAKEIEALKS
jgi:hypothetical protein